jgi:hypothetical protein
MRWGTGVIYEERSHAPSRQLLFVSCDVSTKAGGEASDKRQETATMLNSIFGSHFPKWARHRWHKWGQGMSISGSRDMTITRTSPVPPGARLAVGNVVIGPNSYGGGRRWGSFEVELGGNSTNLNGLYIGAIEPSLASDCNRSQAFSLHAHYLSVCTGRIFRNSANAPEDRNPDARMCNLGDRVGVLIQLEGPEGGKVSFFVNRKKISSEVTGNVTGPLVLGVQMLCPGQEVTLIPDAPPPEGMSDHFIA